MSELIFELVVIFLMLLVNAVFAAYEIALASVSMAKLQRLRSDNVSGSASALFMKEHMEGSLTLVQLAITVAGAIAAATGGAGVGEYLVPYLETLFGISNTAAEVLGIAVFVIPLSAVTIIFSELVPKIFAIENKETITLFLSPSLSVIYRFLYPVISVFEKAVKSLVTFSRKLLSSSSSVDDTALEDLWEATALARSRNLIGIFEEKLANSAVLLSRKTLAEAVLPAEEAACIPADFSLSDALVKAHMDMHTRFPVTEGNGLSSVTGYVNFKDIVTALRLTSGAPSLRAITRPIKRLPVSMTLSKALQEMLRDSAHMAVVFDGPVVTGLITMEDIVEMLVGDIGDEYDRLPVYVHKSGEGVIAGGGCRLGAVCAQLGVHCADEAILLDAWTYRSLGREPRGGDVIRNGGLELWVRKTRRHHLLEAVVSVYNA